MPNMDIVDGKYLLSETVSGAGTTTHTLSTQNTFVDKNIDITVSVAAGALGSGTGSVSASTNATGLLGSGTSTQPQSGKYITVDGTANVAVATGGWIDQGEDVDVSIADYYYPVNEASQTISGGSMSEGTKSSAIVSDGSYDGSSYDTSDKVKFESGEASGEYKIHATGNVVVYRSAVTKQVTQSGYMPTDSTAQTVISNGSITVVNPDTNYFIKKSTLSASTVTPSTTAQTVTVGEGYAPSDRTITVSAVSPGSATPSTANTGLSTYFNSGTSADHDVEITPQYNIDTAGNFDVTVSPVSGTSAYYSIKEATVTTTTTTVSGTTANRGTYSETVGWKDTAETLNVATFANSATSGTSYVDISGTTDAPVLVSGDYMYINGGYVDNLKISLAKLVPDGSDVKGHNEYILSGHSAYDDDGTLVAGSIPTYNGAYVVG